jgi:hypothetical protein
MIQTAESIGLTRDEASKFKKLAEIPDDEFEARLVPRAATTCVACREAEDDLSNCCVGSPG